MIQNSAYLFSRTRHKHCLFAALFIVFTFCENQLFSFNILVNEAHAQTAFEIKTNESNLKQEYRDELDKWMLLAYEGDTEAQFKVGVLFTNDQFSQPDFEQAVYWYKQAARQGHVLAQYNLGHQYLMGVGVRKNELTAMQWWQKAAESDHALAQFNIGRAYFLGIGFEKDQVLSKYWFKRAAYNKEPKSIDVLNELGWSDDSIIASKPKKPKKPKTTDRKSPAKKPDNAEVSKSNQERIKRGWKTRNQATTPALSSRITPITNEASNNTKIKPSNRQVSASSKQNKNTKQAAKIKLELPNIAKQNRPPTTRGKTKQLNSALSSTGNKSSGNKSKASSKTQPSKKSLSAVKSPIALFTNPQVRSVLIAIINDPNNLNVHSSNAQWSLVNSKIGFPVWVHEDFLRVNNNRAVITGQTVNARSVPIITNGTIVGSFNQGEKVKILTKRKEWYRVASPLRFKAWAKTDDLKLAKQAVIASKKQVVVKKYLTKKIHKPDVKSKTIKIDSKPPVVDIPIIARPLASKSKSISSNDNVWLFSQAADSYTLQLASFDNQTKEQEFLANAKQIKRSKLHKFVVKGDGINWTYLLYGSYSTIKKAEKAKSKIKQKFSWPRTFGKIQQNRCVAWSNKKPTPKEYREYCSL